jgi:hypothetical protein
MRRGVIKIKKSLLSNSGLVIAETIKFSSKGGVRLGGVPLPLITSPLSVCGYLI